MTSRTAVTLEVGVFRAVSELRDDRDRLYLSENAVSAAARTLLAETGGEGDAEAWDCIWRHALDDQRADAIDRDIERIEERGTR